ncbi:hypothetical protein BDV30DRAFT_247614 [Aspergillus minisclerotigenes]|uniref:Uncharacterized protein n=1 Tax=Aspergillus minisclerotigenes TaxID=656917 RepID=A0A5N6JBI0_9EURO|nr:hypothetical protein BDV30DRAFT_247614 [Aspergillus minisclerotigenes]
MLIFVALCCFACTVSAVKFYGDTPSVAIYTTAMNRLAEPVEDNLSIGSVFVTSDLASKNGSDYLADNGIFDTTLVDFVTQRKGWYAAPVSSIGLDVRAPKDQLNCENNPVVDKISPANQKHICNAVKSLVGGGVAAVSALIDNTVCSERSTGQPVKCHTIVAFIGTAGVTMTTSEVGDYCSEYLSANDKKCGSQGVTGDTGNKRAYVAVVNTQADDTSCSGLRGKCTEIPV